MGNTHIHRGRLTPAVMLMATVALLLVVAFMAVGASIGAPAAQALPTFTNAVNGIGPCVTCHPQTQTHTQATHAGVYPTCSNCHPNGDTSQPPLPSKCAVCHGGTTAILAKATHTSIGCGTTPGCHGVPPVIVTTTMTEKISPTSIKLKKSVKVSGTAGPAATLAGAKVALKAELKVGTKWTKQKSGTATVSATGAYTWKYTPKKKGSYRVTASIAATSTYTAKSMSKTFKVK
jgi:hypothetical protein